MEGTSGPTRISQKDKKKIIIDVKYLWFDFNSNSI